MLQLGIIGHIDEIENEVVRFYSFIGYCVSTAAEIEHMLFNCYYAASDISKKESARQFYKSGKFLDKLAYANTAIQTLFSNAGAIKSWNEIFSEIDNLGGAKGARNVLGHNPLSWDIYVNDGDDNVPYLFELAVSRNSNEAAAKERPERKENLKSVREEACALNGANMRLWHFYDTHLKTRYRAEG